MKLPEYGRGPIWHIIQIATAIAIPGLIIKEILDNPNQFDGTDWVMTTIAFAVVIAIAVICYLVVKRNNRS